MKVSLNKLLIVFFFVAVPAYAAQEVPTWEFAGWYGGGCYTDIEPDTRIEQRAYLASDVAGIWRTDDRGENWYFLNRGLGNTNVALIAISPLDSNLVFAGTQNGLFRSLDAGKNWKECPSQGKHLQFSRPASHRSISLSPIDPRVVFIGTAEGRVYMSRDSGNHWKALGKKGQPFESPGPITGIQFSASENALYVSSEEGLLRYSFKRSRWEETGCPAGPVYDLKLLDSGGFLYAASGADLLVSSDSAATWKKIYSIAAGSIRRVEVAKSGNLILLAWEKDWTGGVMISEDSGKTWRDAESGFTPDAALNPTRAWAAPGGRSTSVRADPFDSRIVYRTDWWGVWRSDDAGLTWKEKIKGAPNSVAMDIVLGPQGQLYVSSMDNGLLKSDDSGKTYKAIFPRSGYDRNINGHVWRVISRGGKSPSLVATSSPWDVDINQVIVIADGSADFNLVREGLPEAKPRFNTMWERGYPRGLDSDPANPDTVYLGIDGDDLGGLFVSRDGGSHWEKTPAQPGSLRIYHGLKVDPMDPKTIYWGACADNGGVFTSVNGGKSFERAACELNCVLNLAAAKNGTVYAAGDRDGPVLYVSRDRGKNFRMLKKFSAPGALDAISIDPGDERRIAVSVVKWMNESGGRIFLSNDAGETWMDVTGDLPPGAGASAMVFSADGQYLYIARYAGSVYKLRLAKKP